jgi:hypothetical protein
MRQQAKPSQAKPSQAKKIILSNRRTIICSRYFLLQRISPVILILITTSCNKNDERHITGEIFNAGSIFSDETHLITKRFEIFNGSSRVIKVNHKRCSCNCSNAAFSIPSIPANCLFYMDIIVHLRKSSCSISSFHTEYN